MALPFAHGEVPLGYDVMQWYYANDGQRHGPVSAEEFTRLVESGVIRAHTLVWRAGMPTWKPHSELAPPPLTAAPGSPGGQTAGPAPAQATATVAGGSDVVIQGYGGFWRRLLAKFIDGFITQAISWVFLLPLFFVTMGAAGTFTPGVDPTPEQMAAIFGFQLIAIGVQVVIGLIYSVFFLKKYAATPGKMALGLKVFRADSRPLSIGRIIGRYFAEWLSYIPFFIGYIMAAFDDEKRTLHDRIADTRVVIVRP